MLRRRDAETMNQAAETILESEAAALFLYTLVRRVRDSWHGILSQLRDLLGSNDFFSSIHENDAQWDLVVAVMSLELGALKNLFSPGQAQRLFDLSLEHVPQGLQPYTREALYEYNTRYDADAASSLNPALAAGEILYGRWGLPGDEYQPDELFIAPNQILADALTVTVTSFLGIWKEIATNFDVRP